MSQKRVSGERCPINEQPLSIDMCQPCRFFRGASRMNGGPWTVNCNWPRDGSNIESPRVPEAFTRAWE